MSPCTPCLSAARASSLFSWPNPSPCRGGSPASWEPCLVPREGVWGGGADRRSARVGTCGCAGAGGSCQAGQEAGHQLQQLQQLLTPKTIAGVSKCSGCFYLCLFAPYELVHGGRGKPCRVVSNTSDKNFIVGLLESAGMEEGR